MRCVVETRPQIRTVAQIGAPNTMGPYHMYLCSATFEKKAC